MARGSSDEAYVVHNAVTMTYRFIAGESASDGVRRIAVEEIDAVLCRLDPGAADLDDAIHEARVSCKRLRALLRLMRGAMSGGLYRRENMRFRDAARHLSDVRDAAVFSDAFERLVAPPCSYVAPAVVDALRARLAEHPAHDAADKRRVVHDVVVVMRDARHHAERWHLQGEGFGAMMPGLERTYRGGRDLMRKAAADNRAGNFHDWRKEVKYLLYQVRALTPIWPEMLRRHARELERLAERLSDHHDLVILARRIIDLAGDSTEHAGLHALIDRRCLALEADALFRGRLLFAERPRQFVLRMRAYWRARRSAA